MSCARDPAADAALYAQVVGQRAPDPARDLGRCRKLGDPALAGDCALVVATRGAEARREPPGTWCASVPDGTWRAECWFQAAEAARRRGGEERAAELCFQAGPFKDDCAQHLWQTQVHTLIRADRSTPDFVGKLAVAERIYGEWAPHLSESSDLETRFWAKYYQNGFETAGRVDLGWCDGLPEAHLARCVAAAEELVRRELAPDLDRSGGWAGFCALEHPDSASAAAWLRLRPDPRLDAVIAARHAEVCPARAQP